MTADLVRKKLMGTWGNTQIGGAERLLLVILPSPRKPTIWLQYLLQSPGSKFEIVHKINHLKIQTKKYTTTTIQIKSFSKLFYLREYSS